LFGDHVLFSTQHETDQRNLEIVSENEEKILVLEGVHENGKPYLAIIEGTVLTVEESEVGHIDYVIHLYLLDYKLP